MKTLYESIIGNTGLGLEHTYNTALSNYAGDGKRLEINVPFDFFMNRITYDDFVKICTFPLIKVRKEHVPKGSYLFTPSRMVTIVLKDGALAFMFTKDGAFIRCKPIYTSEPISTYWGCPDAFKNNINSFGINRACSIEKQLDMWFKYLKENISNIKKGYTVVKHKL